MSVIDAGKYRFVWHDVDQVMAMKKNSTALTVIAPRKPPANLKTLGRALAKAKTPEQVLNFERLISAYEAYMRRAGFSQGDLHEINENRMRARWKLGQMLAAMSHKPGRPKRGEKGTGRTLFRELLKQLKLERPRAIEAQRISCLPRLELEKIFQSARAIGELVTITWLVDDARPYWYKASRQQKHKDIARGATKQTETIKPFPLVYADPAWKFSVYSEKGLERTPDQHYPTMTDAEIVEYMKPFLGDPCAVLMWCTSSNLDRALWVFDQCDIEFKSSAVWVKTKEDGSPRGGLGLIFRNQHEILLYGTSMRGSMPGPQYQPPSVFSYPRGRHSAKPPEIRSEIEKMYPDFDESSRCELFARESLPGWSCFGNEANARAAE